MGQRLPGELGQEISGTALLSSRPVFDRHEDVISDVESGAHASDANTDTDAGTVALRMLDRLWAVRRAPGARNPSDLTNLLARTLNDLPGLPGIIPVDEIAWSRSSMMPEGLLDSFTTEEIIDLMAFLHSPTVKDESGKR